MGEDKLKIALLEQSADYTLGKIDNLQKLIETGFDGVHERQDKTNGNVRRNTKWRYMVVGGLIVTNAMLIPMAIIIISKLLDKAI